VQRTGISHGNGLPPADRARCQGNERARCI
jgi:hypothetical protein